MVKIRHQIATLHGEVMFKIIDLYFTNLNNFDPHKVLHPTARNNFK